MTAFGCAAEAYEDGLSPSLENAHAAFSSDGSTLFAISPSAPMDDSSAASLFGVGTLQADGVAASGTRPVLMILVEFSDRPFNASNDNKHYDELMFGNGEQSVAKLYEEMSKGRFAWTNAGIQLVKATDDPATPCKETTRACAFGSDAAWTGVMSRALKQTGDAGLFDFNAYNLNGDDRLTQHELQVIFVDAGGGNGGAVRDFGCMPSQSGHKALLSCGRKGSMGEAGDVATFAHELGHSLGIAWDLYNDTFDTDSRDLTLMSGFAAVHMDPYHKMRLGWTSPLVFDVSRDVGTCVEQNFVSNPDADPRPVLLYDSRRGTNEYFLLEQRRRVGHDSTIASEGIAVWHVKLRADGRPFQVRGRAIGPGNNGRLDTPINTRDAGRDYAPWGRPDGVIDSIVAGSDLVLDSIAQGDDTYSMRNFILTRGVPTAAGAAPTVGGARLWRHTDGWFRLQWVSSAEGAAATFVDAGFAVRAGRQFPGQDWVGLQFWKDNTGLTYIPVDTSSISRCLDDTIIQSTAGINHTCFLRANGQVYCTGSNGAGALGDGTTESLRTSPVLVSTSLRFTQIDAGLNYTCGKTTKGYVACWGFNADGELGVGDRVSRATPTYTPLSDVAKVIAGPTYACALHNNRTVSCWGENLWGQLGAGDWALRTSPALIAGLSNVTDVALGPSHACASTSAGQVYCWGSNLQGELGVGDSVNRSRPTLLPTLAGASKVVAGQNFTCALQNNGAVQCWGLQNAGQLGDGLSRSRNVPGPARISGVTALAAGGAHVCAKLSTGVSCWGEGTYGQLGTGRTLSMSLPYPITGTSDVMSLDANASQTCVIRTGGTTACTGRNEYGQIGNRTQTRAIALTTTTW